MPMSCDDANDYPTISVEHAAQYMLAAVDTASGHERVPLADAVGRVLAESILAPRSVPGHTNAAVDGYAVRGVDLPAEGRPAEFRVVGSAYAGAPYRGGRLGAGDAVKIMTGAVIPEGADTVVMQEHVRLLGGNCIQLETRQTPFANVRHAGEDLLAGAAVLACGRWLTAADIGLLASLGLAEISVYRRLRVGVLSTGNEVHALGEVLAPGSIYDSNRYALTAALQRMGVQVIDLGIVRDEPDELRDCLRAAARYTDVIISTGGVSSGEADWVRSVVSDLGRIGFWKVAMKPGRPLSFGSIDGAVFFGLPGNPVAVLVAFYWFVRPVLEKRMGVQDRPLIPFVEATTVVPLRKKPGRMEFQRGVLQATAGAGYRVSTTGEQGSGILRSMSLANGLIVLPEPLGAVEAGTRVQVLPFAAVL